MQILVDPTRNVLVVPPNPRVSGIFPHSKALPNGALVLPHNPDEVRVLRNLGYEVPSPIMSNYDWCNTVPFRAQRVTAAMLVVEPRAYVLSTMGTGKTRSVLFAYDYLRKNGLAKKMLVAAPLSTLAMTWAREVMQIMPKYRVGIVYGSKAKRIEILNDKRFDIYVINHAGLSVVEDTILATFGENDVLCLDEVAVFRNARAVRSKCAQKLAKDFKYVWGLTGTPTPKDPTDAYGILRLVNPAKAPRSFTGFRAELMQKVSNFIWVAKKDAEHHLAKYFQPSIRFTLDECVDMPPVVKIDYDVAMSPDQKTLYEQMRKHCRALLDAGQVTAVNEAVLINKLLQIASGCVHDTEGEAKVIDAAPRLEALRDAIEANDRSMIIFCPFVVLVEHLASKIQDLARVHVIHGSVSAAARNAAFHAFQSSNEKQIIVAHPATMSHGLTLTNANTVLWYGPTHDLEIYEQANARIIRPGQQASRIILSHMVGSPVEKKVYQNLARKRSVQGALLELLEGEN